MKGKTSLAVFLVILLVIPFASASVFDWITGLVTGEIVLVKEQVKCIFYDSTSEQKCYNEDGSFACSGIGSCIVDVSGENGKAITWKSSCGDFATTTIDGANEEIGFKCPQPVTTQPAPTPAVEYAKEQIICSFINSNTQQKCYTDDGRFVCYGTTSCAADVSWEKGKTLTWKSSCSGSASTIMDGNNDNVEFKCETSPTPSCGNGACESGETCSSCPADCGQCATLQVKEQVICNFLNSNSYQKCYTSDGKFVCSGMGSCTNTVYGAMGTNLEWKSSCSGYAYTVTDGNNDYVEFKCDIALPKEFPSPVPAETATTTPAPTQTPAETVREKVECIFTDSSFQKCYASSQFGEFSCGGSGRCTVDVVGVKGAQLTWKSSCGGYAYSMIDGANDYIAFKCEKPPQPISTTPTPISTPVPLPTVPSTITQPIQTITIGCDSSSVGKAYCEGEKLSRICMSVQNMATMQNVFFWSDNVCSNRCENGKCMDDKFEISSAQGIKDIYAAGEQLNLVIKGVEKDGTPAAPEEGFNIQFYIDEYPLVFMQPSIGDNANYKDGYWYGNIKIPGKVSTYRLEIFLYCSISGSLCEQKYGERAQVVKQYYFSTVQSDIVNEIVCQPAKCDDGTIQTCEIKEEKCVCTTCQQIIMKPVCGNGICETGEGEVCVAPASSVKCEEGKECKVPTATCGIACPQDCRKEETNVVEVRLNEKFKLQVSQAARVKDNDREISITLKDLISYKCKETEMGVIETKKINEKVAVAEAAITGGVVAETQAQPTTTILKCAAEGPKALLHIFDKNKGTSMTMALNLEEKKQIEDFAILFLGYDYASRTGIFLVSKETFSCPEKCKCDENGKVIECMESCKEGETLCPDGKCREKCEMISQSDCNYGCMYDGKCFPMGVRSKGLYCSTDLAMNSQKTEDKSCDNNFECSTNVCVDGKCISSGLINKFMGWFKRLFGPADREEAKEEITKIIDCGASSECMENAFKVCKPAKMSQQQAGPISEIAIVGLEGKNCVLKFVAGNESMECKFENYALGMKDVGPGSLEQYCSGTLTYRLAATPKMIRQGEAPALNSVVVATKLSADPNDQRYSFNVHDPDGISEFSIVKSNFGEVAVKVEPQCAKDFTSELKFNPSDLPFRASVIDCGTPVTRQELEVDVQIPVVEKKI